MLNRPIGAFRVIPYYPRQTIMLPPLADVLDISTEELHRQEQSKDADNELDPPNDETPNDQ